MKREIFKKEYCRVCKKRNLQKVLSLGMTPLANAFLTKEQIDKPEKFYPLELNFCTQCGMLQLEHVLSPYTLFKDYVYVSSTSKVFVRHFEQFAQKAIKTFNLNSDSLVVDIGSNDGILLKPFFDKGVKVLGIEPAGNIAKIARSKGIETISEFFSVRIAKKIVEQKGKTQLVTATNVFAHIDDLDEVLNGLNTLLDNDGVFTMEAPYLIDFVQKKYFDLVYHEHLSYWSVRTLGKLFGRFNMTIFDVEKVASHGGSLRIYAKKKTGKYPIQKSVQEFIKRELAFGLDKPETFIKFQNTILDNKVRLMNILTKIKRQNKFIAGYGAPAKGNTLLNYFGIGSDFLDYIIDDSPVKQGLYTPGTHIPVFSSEQLKKQPVDYLLILAWNFAESIMNQYSGFKKSGGKFIIPVPVPKII